MTIDIKSIFLDLWMVVQSQAGAANVLQSAQIWMMELGGMQLAAGTQKSPRSESRLLSCLGDP